MNENNEGCFWCEKAWGVFGLVIAAGFLYVGIDVLTDGAISRLISPAKEVSNDDATGDASSTD